MRDSTGPSAFPTTHWSLVLAAGEITSEESRKALAQLCSSYWYPVFVFVRRKGYSRDDAQDLTQSFFARLIEKKDIADADRDRGRFRTFLLTACQHFLANEYDRTRTKKRGGGELPVSIDTAVAEARYELALSHEETPERLYERQWGITLLEAVLEDLRKEYAAAGKENVFHRLNQFLTVAEDAGTHSEAARDLGMSRAAVKMAVHRLRRSYRQALRRRVADTVHPDEIDHEIQHLVKILSS